MLKHKINSLKEYLDLLDGLYNRNYIDQRQLHLLTFIAHLQDKQSLKTFNKNVRVPLFQMSLQLGYSIMQIRTIIKKCIDNKLLKKWTINKGFKDSRTGNRVLFRLQTYYRVGDYR